MKSYLNSSYIVGLLLICLLTLSGCSNDNDTAEPAPDNHIVIEGKKYKINDVILQVEGPRDLSYHNNVSQETHYGYMLHFTDGTFTNNVLTTDATYKINISFFTTIGDHTEEFEGGTFNAIIPKVYFAGNSPESESFFTGFFIRIDSDGDGTFDTFKDASNGIVTATGSGHDFKFNFNTTLSDPDPHTPVTGGFEGFVELLFD
jgi:hypothetical protein